MGGKYRQVLQPFFDNKFYVVFDKRGIGGYLSVVSRYRKLKTPQLLQDIAQFQILECSEFLWNRWYFNPFQKTLDVNRPHCCFYCTFKGEKGCDFAKLYSLYYEKQLEDMTFIQNLSKVENQKVVITSKLNSHQKTTLLKFTNPI